MRFATLSFARHTVPQAQRSRQVVDRWNFLTERYCFYNVNHHDEPYRLDIHHVPWALQPARAEFSLNTMAEVHGITLPDEPPLLHFVDRQDMVAWMPLSLVRRTDFALQPSIESEG